MRLIEVSVFGCQRSGGGARFVIHLVQRCLEPDDVCIALWAKANPGAHQAVQVTRADTAATGQIRNPQIPVLSLNFAERCCHSGVQVRMLEPLQQKPLEHIKAPVRSGGATFRDKITKGRAGSTRHGDLRSYARESR